MRYELSDYEWIVTKPMLPNKPRGIPGVNDRRVLNGIFWVLRSGAPGRDLPDAFGGSVFAKQLVEQAQFEMAHRLPLPWRTSLDRLQ